MALVLGNSLWAVILGALLGVGVLGGTAWKAYRLGQDSILAQEARDNQVRFETLQLAQQAAAEEIRKIEVRNVTIRQKVERETRIEPRYSECVNTDGVMQSINAALAGSAAPARGGELPRPDAARR